LRCVREFPQTEAGDAGLGTTSTWGSCGARTSSGTGGCVLSGVAGGGSGVQRSDTHRRRGLTEAYLKLATFPEVRSALAELKRMKLRLAILSNGSPAMLRPVVANAGLRDLVRTVISVDRRKIYKPAPEVYRLAVGRLGVPKTAIGFVSSNCWDACGAKSFGFPVFWINRTEAPVDELGVVPDYIIKSLDELPALVRR